MVLNRLHVAADALQGTPRPPSQFPTPAESPVPPPPGDPNGLPQPCRSITGVEGSQGEARGTGLLLGGRGGVGVGAQ